MVYVIAKPIHEEVFYTWNVRISRIRFGENALTVSVNAWRPSVAVLYWKDVALKAEKNYLHNIIAV